MSKRVGMYAWAGPGTIRLLKTKYFHPRVDQEGFLHAYDLEYLSQAKKLFGVTDAWVTYSWGFSDTTEVLDYRFLHEKLANFKKLKIRTHAYIQGLNVVTTDFPNADFFCQDPWGRKIAYSKGRSFICPNHPDTLRLILNRVGKAVQEDVSGIFLDNILFGLPPYTVATDILPFFGCSCRFCQRVFQKMFGYALPIREKRGSEISDYLNFRAQTMTHLIACVAQLVHAHKKEFGINLYDPTLRLDTLYYGYSLPSIETYLDYLLIENHSLPNREVHNNTHLIPLIKSTSKPVFVVSYKAGIGYEEQFTQKDVDAIFSESRKLNYSPCLKVTEFTTRGRWHILGLAPFSQPSLTSVCSFPVSKRPAKPSTRIQRLFVTFASRLIISLITASQENAILASLAIKSGIHKNQVRASRSTHL